MERGAIPLGERDGALYRAHQVENGLRCGCVCPGCRRPLVAANQGKKRLPYFRHAESEGCTRGRSEGIRRAAVQLIAEKKELLLAGFAERVSLATRSGRLISKDVNFRPALVTPDKVDRFVDLDDDLRAHAFISRGEYQLIIRVRVSSRREHERRRRLREMQLSSMEIDLHRLTDAQVNDLDLFEQAVLYDPENREWIRSLRAEQFRERAMSVLREQVQKIDQDEAEVEAARIAAEKEREKQLLEERVRKAAHRKVQRAMARKQSTTLRAGGRSTRQQRQDLIAATMWKAAREWGGKGKQCTACYLISPPEAEFCFYCAATDSSLREVSYSVNDLAKTLHHRLRSSAAPDQSIRNVPDLVVVPEV